MSNGLTDKEKKYQRMVGAKAQELGVSPDKDDEDILLIERVKRAEQNALPVDSSWFIIFCYELKNGALGKMEVPEWYEGAKQNWDNDPPVAFRVAVKAFEIFRQ